MNLQQGQSVPLSDLVGDVEQFEMKMIISDTLSKNLNLKFYTSYLMVGYDENDTIIDEYVIDSMQPKTPCHSVVFRRYVPTPLFQCQLSSISSHIKKFKCTFKIHSFGSIISKFTDCHIEFCVKKQVISTFHFSSVKPIRDGGEFGEFYRQDGIWYFLAKVEKLSNEVADDFSKKQRELYDSYDRQKQKLLAVHEGENGFKLCPANIDLLFKVYKKYMNHSKAFIMRESMFSQRIPSKGNRLLVLQSYVPFNIKDENNRYITLEIKNENKAMESAYHKGNNDYTVTYNEQRHSYQFSNLDFPFEIPRLSQAEIEDYYFEVNFSDEIVMEFNNLSRSKLFNRNKPVDILIRDNEIVALKQDSKLVKMSLSGIFDADIILRSYNFFDFYPQRIILNHDREFWLLLRYDFKGLNIYEHLEVINRVTVMNNEFRVYQIYKPVVKKKNRKLATYLQNNEKMVSILFIKHSSYSGLSYFPEFFCKYEYEHDKALLAEKQIKNEAKKEKVRLAAEKKEISKELESANAFHSQMHNKAGTVISSKTLKVLYSIYNLFMNKSNVFMIRNSQFIHHRLSSKEGNLLVFNMDLSNLITDKDGNPVSLYLNHCRDEMKHFNLFDDFALISEDKNKYCFEDTAMVFQVDKLNEDERDDHSFEVELFDESYIDCGTDFIKILKLNSSESMDLIIINNKLVSAQQGAVIQDLNESGNLNSKNADIILRCHNFYFFTKKFFYPIKEHFIIKNGDGEFWLLSQGEYSLEKQRKHGKPTSYPFKIYEHLEVLRNF